MSVFNCKKIINVLRLSGYVNSVIKICMEAGNWFMRILAPILFVACELAIFAILYVFFLHILPSVSQNSRTEGIIHCIIAVFLGFNIVFNHWACFLTSPGSSTQFYDDPSKVFGERIITAPDGRKMRQIRTAVAVAPNVLYRFCKYCKTVKPPRTHHDSITRKCVYEMDHFCPWMNNTVGYYNYRYFILFMFYLLLGCLDCLLLTSGSFGDLYRSASSDSLSSNSEISMPTSFIFVFTVTLSGAIAVAILLGWHIYLIISNQTTIEFYSNAADILDARNGTGPPFKNAFDIGWRKNIRRVFGDVPWYLALLPSVRDPPSPLYPFEFTPDMLMAMIL